MEFCLYSSMKKSNILRKQVRLAAILICAKVVMTLSGVSQPELQVADCMVGVPTKCAHRRPAAARARARYNLVYTVPDRSAGWL
jgi:hypothetical protein